MFFVYILHCADGSYYVGSTSDLTVRIKEHNAGINGAVHTLRHQPFTLVYTETFNSQAEAMRRERQLKGWSHAKKEALINGDTLTLKMLSKRRKY